jgi:hypothetical protein
MSSAGAEQIIFRTGIAAVNSTSHLRVYTQDTSGGIRESLYENGWANGTAQNVIARGKLGTPIAATSKELKNIRVYYVSEGNILKEACYDSGRGWYDGDLSRMNYQVAPYSKVAACFLAGTDELLLRVYAQQNDNTIQEFGYDQDGKGWQKMTNLGQALPGTEIASTSFKASQLGIRVYLQDNNLKLFEKAYDNGKGWYTGGFSVQSAPPRTSLAATSFGSISLRVYYGTADNRIQEKGYDSNEWYDGGFNERCIPGSEVAVIHWGSGGDLNLRVYYQLGELVTGVTELMWNGGWRVGKAAIPPA